MLTFSRWQIGRILLGRHGRLIARLPDIQLLGDVILDTKPCGHAVLLPLKLAILALSCATAHAMTFTVHDPCGRGNSESCAPRILGRGPITTTDARDLRALVQARTLRNMGGYSGITLHSPGGSLAGGLALGRAIRELGLDTLGPKAFVEVVEKKDDFEEVTLVAQVECHSACVYAFAGGVRRSVTGAVFGVHQFASRSPTPQAEGQAQVTSVVLRNYLQEMGVSGTLLDIASVVPPHKVQTLRMEEIAELRVDNTAQPQSRWTVSALSSGQPVLTNIKQLSTGKTLAVSLRRVGDALRVYVVMMFDPSVIKPERLSQFPDNEEPQITMEADGRELKLASIQRWRSYPESNGRILYDSISGISASALPSTVRTIRISGGHFSRANLDVGFEDIELGTEGLGSGLQLLQRAR